MYTDLYDYFLSQPHRLCTFHKSDMLWNLGETIRYVYYIKSGITKTFIEHEDGHHKILFFHSKGSVFPGCQNSEFKIEAFVQDSAENGTADNIDRESAPSNISLSLKNGRFMFSLAQRLGSSKFTVKFPNAESEIHSGIAIAETGSNGSRLIPFDGFARIKPQNSIWEIVKDGVSAVVPAKESDKKIIFKHVYSRERERFGNFIKTAEQLRRSVIFKYSPNGGFAAELILPKAFFAMPIKH